MQITHFEVALQLRREKKNQKSITHTWTNKKKKKKAVLLKLRHDLLLTTPRFTLLRFFNWHEERPSIHHHRLTPVLACLFFILACFL